MNLFRKSSDLLVNALRQGWSPSALSWSVGWAVGLGLFPIMGISAPAMLLAAGIWKLNGPVMIGLNQGLNFIKIALILFHIRVGEWLFQEADPFRISMAEFTRRFAEAPGATFSQFAMTFVHAIAGWALLLPLYILGPWLLMHLLTARWAESQRLSGEPCS